MLRDRNELIGLNKNELTNEEFDSIFETTDLNVCDACGIIDKTENLYWKNYAIDVESLCKGCFRELEKLEKGDINEYRKS